MVATIHQANWLLVALGVGTLLAAYTVFALRWTVLLSSTAWLRVRDTFSFIMIGYLANTLFPLRLGEVARAALLGRRHGINTALVFGSVVLERTLDVLTVLILVVGLSFIMSIPPVIRSGVIAIAGAGVVALIGLLFLAYTGGQVPAWVKTLSGFAPRVLTERMGALLIPFAQGLEVLRDGRKLGLVLLLSVLGWIIAGISTGVYISAFHLLAPWYAGFFVLAVIILGVAIPSSPGHVGVYHYAAVLALSVWVSDKSAVLGFAIATHGISVLINVLIGSGCLVRESITLQSIGLVQETMQQSFLKKDHA